MSFDQRGFAHILVFIILLAGLVLGVYLVSQKTNLIPKAFESSETVDLSLNPTPLTVTKDTNFNLDVGIDAKTVTPAGAEIHIKYDPTQLQALSIQPGSFLPNVLAPAQIGNGTASIVLGSDLSSPKNGIGTLATISFKALTTTPYHEAPVSFDNSTQVSVVGQTDTSSRVGNLNLSRVRIVDQTQSATAKFLFSPQTFEIDSNQEIGLKVQAQTDTDSANLFTAKINFDPNLVMVTKIDKTGTFIQSWADEPVFDNNLGRILLVGGVPAPGLKTTGSPQTMATIYFKPKTTGTANFSFDGSSTIYRNSDNVNIFGTGGTATANVVASSVTEEQPPASTPNENQSNIGCAISNANWSMETGQSVEEGAPVQLIVQGAGDCQDQEVVFDVKQDRGLLPGESNSKNPGTAKFVDNKAIGTWIAEYHPTSLFNVLGDPKYYFEAKLMADANIIKSIGGLLQVKKLTSSEVLSGDSDGNGEVGLQDMSVLLSNWFKKGVSSRIDLNKDGVVNSFDFSAMSKILKAKGIIFKR